MNVVDRSYWNRPCVVITDNFRHTQVSVLFIQNTSTFIATLLQVPQGFRQTEAHELSIQFVVHALTKDSVFGTRHFLIILCGMQSRASKRWEISPFREMYCFMGVRQVSLKYFNCREMKTNEQTNRQENICNKLMKVNLTASNCPSQTH